MRDFTQNTVGIVAPPLIVQVGTTSIRFRATKNAIVGGSLSIGPFIKQTIQEYEYVEKYKRNIVTRQYSHYDSLNGMAILPRYALQPFCNFVGKYYPVELENLPVTIPRPINVKMKSKFSPKPEQVPLIEFMVSKRNYKPVSAQTGIGKELSNHTLIKIPGGWKKIGKLQVGDTVTSVDGTPTEVIGVYPQGVKPIYLMKFIDGRTINAGSEHLWEVIIDDTVQVVTTTTVAGHMYGGKKSVFIPYPESEIDSHTHTKEEIESLYKVGCGDPLKWKYHISPESDHSLRLAFVQGALDTYGYISNGNLICMLQHHPSAELLQSLIRSLGGGCKKKLARSRTTRLLIGHPNKSSLVRDKDKKKLLKSLPVGEFDRALRVKMVLKLPKEVPCTCISIAHPRSLYVAENFIATHNTFCSEAAICELKVATLIVLNGLIKQWYDSLRLHTTVRADDIYVVQGADSLRNLWLAYGNGYRPSVIIFSARTLSLYAINPILPYSEMPSYRDFCQAFGIGLKIMDEVHIGFHGNTLLDLVSNIRHNIYLSATYQRTNPVGNRIFDMIFPRELRYGEEFFEKYTTVVMMSYSLGIPERDQSKFRTHKGYNHSLYENYLLGRGHLFRELMVSLKFSINKYFFGYRKPGQRLLVLCQTKKFASTIAAALKKEHPKLKVNVFFSGTSGKLGNNKNLKGDIIVSTHKSCGTGRDIPMLKTCINLVSFSSEPLAGQVMGRLRKLQGEDTLFIDMWNKEIGTHYTHSRKRMNVYEKKALKVSQETYN